MQNITFWPSRSERCLILTNVMCTCSDFEKKFFLCVFLHVFICMSVDIIFLQAYAMFIYVPFGGILLRFAGFLLLFLIAKQSFIGIVKHEPITTCNSIVTSYKIFIYADLYTKLVFFVFVLCFFSSPAFL